MRMQLPLLVSTYFYWTATVAQWYYLRPGDTGGPRSNHALGKQRSRDHPINVPTTPMLPNANLRYQEALD